MDRLLMSSDHLRGKQHREVPSQSRFIYSPRAGGTQGWNRRVQAPNPARQMPESTPLGFRATPAATQRCPLGQWTRAGRVVGAPPSSGPSTLAFNQRARAPLPLGSAERASGLRRARGAGVQSQGQRQLAGMAPAATSGGSTLPSGFSVFFTFPNWLFIFEFVSDSAPYAGKGNGVG